MVTAVILGAPPPPLAPSPRVVSTATYSQPVRSEAVPSYSS